MENLMLVYFISLIFSSIMAVWMIKIDLRNGHDFDVGYLATVLFVTLVPILNIVFGIWAVFEIVDLSGFFSKTLIKGKRK